MAIREMGNNFRHDALGQLMDFEFGENGDDPAAQS